MRDLTFISDHYALDSEKRERYRTSLPTDLLSVATVDEEGRRTVGYVFDLSASGLGLFFGSSDDPGYEAGTVLWLCINSPYLREPIVAPAQVRRVTASKLGRLYGFRLLEWQGLFERIPTAAAGVFNRRSAERVTVDHALPIKVVTQEPPVASSWEQVFQCLKGALTEVSPTGLSFSVSSGVAHIEPHQCVDVSFTLPGSDYRFAMGMEIIRCAPGPWGIECGARFDPARTELFHEKQARLSTLLG